MAFVAWTSEFSVGVDAMDTQHKRLLGLINELHDAMTERKGKDKLGETLQRLKEYVLKHFADEEVLMKKYNFPGLVKHLAEHESLRKRVGEFEQRFGAGQTVSAAELLHFLRDWASNHILTVDSEYGKFIVAQMRSQGAGVTFNN